MTVESLKPRPSPSLPVREHLKRLKQREWHLKRQLEQYACEPQTASRFLQRETLRDRMASLERKLGVFFSKPGNRGSAGEARETLIALDLEFHDLEEEIRAYLHENPRPSGPPPQISQG